MTSDVALGIAMCIKDVLRFELVLIVYYSGSNVDTGWFNSGDGRATVPEEVVVSFSSRMLLFIIPSTL